jgi:hypothetical protein
MPINQSESPLPTQTQQPPSNPLIDTSGQHLIYIGAGSIAILITLIIGLFSRRFIEALLFSLCLSVVLILLILLA